MNDDAHPATGVERRVVLRFEDGAEKTIAAQPGEFVLDAALRQGVPLVHQCRSGSCSTCVAQLIAGDVVMAPGRSTSLLAAEQAEGKRLLCSAHAIADSIVRLHYPISLIYEAERTILPATVAAIEWAAPNAAHLTLEIDDTSSFNFRSGQYVRVKVPASEQWRSYSMASAARELPRLAFLIRILEGGLMSDYLRSRCRKGDRLELEGPMGAFILHPSRARHIFVAGGTGLAPILSMLDEIRHRPGPRPKMLLSFGCASEESFIFRDEVELRSWWMPELSLILSADKVESADSGLIEGTPVDVIGREHIEGRETAAYLCGPPRMIEAARRRLAELGVKSDRIYAEQFVASSIG
jgi:ferredoxin-NADP reductase/ferredoxin